MKATGNRIGYFEKQPGRDSDAWFTPPEYVELARAVLGGIDLDPFSTLGANRTVKADRFFTEECSAFSNEWFPDWLGAGTVFMNPPYGRSMAAAIKRFTQEFDNNCISAAVVLTNNATETVWFHELLVRSAALCLPKGRIRFYNTDGKAVSGNTRGQVFFYFGYAQDGMERFVLEFGTVGHCLSSKRIP